MTDLYILDDHGVPVPEPDHRRWGRWMEANRGNVHVAATTTEDGYWVSTVFLGINHRFITRGDPILWETMIKDPSGNFLDYQQRYDSIDAALEGHQRTVALLPQIVRDEKEVVSS